MFEQHDLKNEHDKVESRLRSIQLLPPRLDRDRLMFLAGQQSMNLPRRTRRLWPALTVASWAACAAIIAVLAARPPQVVVETRVVERVLEVPAEPEQLLSGVAPPSPVVVEPNETAADEGPARSRDEFQFLEELRSPLTALASRPSLYRRTAEPTAVASVEASTSAPLPVGAKTYSELRRELLGDHRTGTAATGPLWWF